MVVGTRQYRVTKAIHWHFTTDKSLAEIGDKLGVSESTVKDYIHDPPADEVREALHFQEQQVRITAFEELKRQLQQAGQRSRDAEHPVKIWTDANDHLWVTDQRDETGELTGKYPIPHDFELGPDHKSRFYARSEVREILDMLIELVGAAEPKQLDVNGAVEHTHTLTMEEKQRLDHLFSKSGAVDVDVVPEIEE